MIKKLFCVNLFSGKAAVEFSRIIFFVLVHCKVQWIMRFRPPFESGDRLLLRVEYSVNKILLDAIENILCFYTDKDYHILIPLYYLTHTVCVSYLIIAIVTSVK